MAEIDKYKHSLLGFFYCPTEFEFIFQNDTRNIAIYRAEEVIKGLSKTRIILKGDLIIGGGKGELDIMCITKKGILFFKDDNFEEFDSYDELFFSDWSPSTSFILGTGCFKLGWNPSSD